MRLQSIRGLRSFLLALAAAAVPALDTGCGDDPAQATPPVQDAVHAHAEQLIDDLARLASLLQPHPVASERVAVGVGPHLPLDLVGVAATRCVAR